MKNTDRLFSEAARLRAGPRLLAAALGAWPGRLRPLVRPALGVFFLLLGVAGLFLPILQGVLFLFIGLSLLAPSSPFLQRQKDRLEERFPRLAEGERQVKDRLAALADRLGACFRRKP